MFKSYVVLLLMVFLLFGCNQNRTEEEMKELWSNAQTTGEIIRRSGTPFNSATDKKLAMDDAQNRLRTGGGLFGKKTSINLLGGDKNSQQTSAGMGLPINPFLWRASIETISFMPLASTDPFAGTIITDWYTAENSLGERCKLNIFINGAEMKTDNLKVSSFCQTLKDSQWVNSPSNSEDNIRLENAILNKAKKLKLTSG